MTTTTSSPQVGMEVNWTLKAGVHYFWCDGYKLFELKQGFGKWTITMFGKDYIHPHPLDPDKAREFALKWFQDEVQKVCGCLSNLNWSLGT